MKLQERSQQVLALLVDDIKSGRRTTYRNLCDRLGKEDQPKVNWVARCLTAVSKHSYEQLGVFISVVVCNDDRGPGEGFMLMVNKHLGVDLSGDFISAHVRTVYALDHKRLDQLLIN